MTNAISERESLRRRQLSDVIGPPFELRSMLGEGGQAEVWLAQDVELSRPVAIKVLRYDAERPEVAHRLRREAVTIARIQSQYIVPVLQFVSRGETSYIVMPFVAGETLASLLRRRGALLPTDAARIVREVALGLAAAHELGVVHRDVKPSNILIEGKTGSARLTDFGIAKALHPDEPSLTATGLLVGSAHYMSPEQYDPAGFIGPASDVYSLGVVAFEMVMGRLPFTGKNIAQLALQHTTEPPESLLSRDNVPAPFAQLVDQCLSKEPGRRPTAQEVADALEIDLVEASAIKAATPRPRALRVAKFVVLLIVTIVLSVLALVFKGASLIALKALLKTLLTTALHLL